MPKNKTLRRNEKELRRLERIAQQTRNNLERTAPNVYQDLSQVYLTPRGYPTLEEFAVMREAQNAYREAHPLQGYTDIRTLGPIAYERWLGKKNSVDGKNHRLPYIAERTVGGGGSIIGRDGYRQVDGTNTRNFYDVPFMSMTGIGGGSYAPTWQSNRNMKEGHEEEKRSRSFLSRLAHTPGSVVPAANFILGGGASTGGNRILDGAFGLAGGALFNSWLKRSMGDVQSDSNTSDFVAGRAADSAATTAALAMLYSLNGHELVVPTSGVTVNPFNKQARVLKREGKKDVKQARTFHRASDKKVKQLQAREQKKTDNLVKLYEKKYGVTPELVVPASSTTDPYGRR